jgi:glycosyltransferase involved in cell wall biosynthesis
MKSKDSRPLTVALPTSTFLPWLGGAEVGLHNIATRLKARGHRPVVILPSPHFHRLRDDGWNLDYEIISFPPKVWGVLRRAPVLGLFWLDRFFAGIEHRYGIDFWHATMGYPTGVAVVHYAKRSDAPHLVRCAGEDIQQNATIGYGARLDPGIDRLVRRWLPQADRLVAITESVAEEYRALGVAEERIVAVPNGVDLARFAQPAQEVDRKALRRELGIDEDCFLFLAVGRHHPKKNFASAIAAAAALKRRSGEGGRAFALLLVGDGVPELAEIVEESRAGDVVRLREAITAPPPGGTEALRLPDDRLVAIYRAADAFVFPSLLETFGIVLVEAMAAGLPVITTDAPGCRDVVRGGRDGLTVPAGNEGALSEAMARLLTEPELAGDLSQRARRRARDFDWESVVDRYLNLYEEGVRRARKPA